eukprot:TRINITY_DN7980_c0_g1_i4.p1 TRINITY_DN7980_c0_g1~~TRINITY_DN7980_c0_g1_i4.p1  ORF type:complete len:967 (+),score=440.03 TRINITY_DN7980_c0_g1_i4:73-2973(+)
MSTLIVLLCALAAVHAAQNDLLNIHVVSHTHDDVGWLKTVDQYYMGSRNDIQHAGVQYILDSVIVALQQDPTRKFIYVEIAFFSRWWNEQNDNTKDIVRKLVANKQLEFINGGWCMNDEATTYYTDIIDQMTWGHQFLLREFGVTPRVGWHIDPFGHSAAQASLFAQMGFDGFFFGRIDYQDFNLRKQQSNFEMIWRGSQPLGSASDIFTGVTYTGYGPLDGFCFDQFCNDPPIQDDPRLHDVNVKSRADLFVAEAKEQASHYRTNNIMLTFGSDFQYENANLWFKNLDKLIKYVNANQATYGVNMFYSTPSMYVDAKHAANQTWSTKSDDFFPYADGPHAYWTGYFVSRPAVKKYVRDMSGYLQMCKQLEAWNMIQFPNNATTHSIQTLAEAMAVAQHHDAVSGTEKQQVAYDYAERLSAGQTECQALTNDVLGRLVSPAAPVSTFTQCPLLNVSVCDVTVSNSSVVVVVYNPLGASRSETIRLPISASAVSVSDHYGQAVTHQVVALSAVSQKLARDAKQGASNVATYEVSFAVSVPAFGYSTYFITPSTDQSSTVQPKPVTSGTVTLENANYALSFNSDSGRLLSVQNKKDGTTMPFNQDWYYYKSSTGTFDDGQASGAYIFRPASNDVVPVASGNVALGPVVTGTVYSEITQTFSDWISQTIRLYHNDADASYIEIEYTVGPVPTNDGVGKEVISRFTTPIQSSQTFYTDANGLDTQQHRLNYRPTWNLTVEEPSSGNYYPINAFAYINDPTTQLTVVTDRSQGGASLTNGQMEIMVHRRTLADDSRGVGEPINEPGLDGRGLVIRGVHRVLLGSFSTTHRALTQRVMNPVRPVFTPLTSSISDFISTHTTSYTALTANLPDSLHLQTFEFNRVTGEYLLRLARINESAAPVTIDLATLFHNAQVIGVRELSLTGNQELASMKRLAWNDNSQTTLIPTLKGTQVTLSAMEIRTYGVKIYASQ